MNEELNKELNKELCELLGICWHEWVTNYGHDSDTLMCKHCWKYPREVACNPDFTTDSGKIALLREMEKSRDYLDFICSLWELYAVDDSYGVEDYEEIRFYLRLITDDTGKLAAAARDFLKKENKLC
jgi:hypothetical protein